MPLAIRLTRKVINRGDTLDAADFSNGFVNAAILDAGQSYSFGKGTQQTPSVSSVDDADTGLAWDGANGLILVSAGKGVGVVSPTGLGIGTLTPDADATAHISALDALLKVDTLSVDHQAKIRVRSRGITTARAELILENLAADGSALKDFVISSGAAGAAYFTDGVYSEAGSVQIGTAQNRPIQTVSGGAVITSHRPDRFEIRAGKDFRLGQNTTTYQTPNCSIIMQAADGSTIYVAAKK